MAPCWIAAGAPPRSTGSASRGSACWTGTAACRPSPAATGRRSRERSRAAPPSHRGSSRRCEVRAKGADVVLAPVLNIVRNPRGGRTQESYGEDTMHLGEMGAAFVRGAQHYAIASVKHFAANSIERTRLGVDVQIDERALREV